MVPNNVVLTSAVVPLREPAAVDLRARLRPDVKPSEVQALLETGVRTPVRHEPHISLEEVDSDEVIVRIAATPESEADGPRLADEVLSAIASVTREGDTAERLAARRDRNGDEERTAPLVAAHPGPPKVLKADLSIGRCAGQMRLLRSLLPDLAAVSRRSQRAVAAATVLMFALLAVEHRPHAVRARRQRARQAAQRVGPEPRAGLRVRGRRGAGPDRRRAGVQAAAGRRWCCGRVGNLWWGFVLYDMAEAPFPSPADAGWLAFYPCAYLCLGLRLRASARDLPRSAWLDGLVGILSVGAIGVSARRGAGPRRAPRGAGRPC